MVELIASTETDLPLIDEWLTYEPYASRAVFNIAFLTASPDSMLCFRLDDQTGPVLFCRIEKDQQDEKLARFHILFGPSDQVAPIRAAKVMIKTMPIVFDYVSSEGYVGIIFDSVSDHLVRFLSKFGFEQVWCGDTQTTDYILKFDSFLP